MRKLIIIVILLFSVIGCSQQSPLPGVNAEPITTKSMAAPPTEMVSVAPSTFAMIQTWAEADADVGRCTLIRDLKDGTSLEKTNRFKWCWHFRNKKINKIPTRECGAKIIDITGSDPTKPGYSSKVIDADTDGDGIDNWWEYNMGLNPCSKSTYGSIPDAELDYDADGIPNGEDPFPTCNSNKNDPAEYYSDCV